MLYVPIRHGLNLLYFFVSALHGEEVFEPFLGPYAFLNRSEIFNFSNLDNFPIFYFIHGQDVVFDREFGDFQGFGCIKAPACCTGTMSVNIRLDPRFR
jgi:hypothetical protein